MSPVVSRALLCLLGVCLLLPTPGLGQGVLLQVGDSGRVSVAPGAKLAVPLLVNLAEAPGVAFASLQGELQWGVGRLRLDSIRADAGAGFTLTANTANLAGGSLIFSLFSNAGLTTTGPLARLYFTAGTLVVLTPTDAGDAAGVSLLEQLGVRPLAACIMASSFGVAPRWGDANANGTVNVVDAGAVFVP